ncbi:MAG TPA: rhodanese-like domain-containing protein [Candidatus Acidoferrales bacterium]|nr:rhodanese-like domain-containing protein [Candidatus Acidoferrales bacterium]
MKNHAALFLAIGALVSAGLLAGAERAGADPARYPSYAQQTMPAGVKPEFIKIDALVNDIIGRKKPLIVDVRSAEEYEEVHIKGAISIPVGDLQKRFAEIPRDRPVVLY